jgi:hypothetical protein
MASGTSKVLQSTVCQAEPKLAGLDVIGLTEQAVIKVIATVKRVSWQK